MQPTHQALKIVSINVTDKFKKKDVDTDQIKHEEENVLDSQQQQDVGQIFQSTDIDFDTESESKSRSHDDDIKQPQFDVTELTEEHVKKGPPQKQPVMRQAQKLDKSNISFGKVQNQDLPEVP